MQARATSRVSKRELEIHVQFRVCRVSRLCRVSVYTVGFMGFIGFIGSRVMLWRQGR